MNWRKILGASAVAVLGACHKEPPPAAPPVSILLVTLDTTRADAVTPDVAPAFNAIAKTARRFDYAYCAVPQTLSSHTSMMTGLYPGGHGLHENGRYLSPAQPLLAERLKAAGYRTAAFVSAFALARRFGLARGFDVYDDEVPEPRNERSARDTTDRALAYLAKPSAQPLFLWVHYYEPHFPYEPPEPFRGRFASRPYLGEVATMDEQLGRLAAAFRQRFGANAAMIVVGDHGEGLGDHGEQQHGNLMYQSHLYYDKLANPTIADSVLAVSQHYPIYAGEWGKGGVIGFWEGQCLPRVADELYRSARRLRVFVAEPPRAPLASLPDLLTVPAADLRRRLDEESPLLNRRTRA